MFIWSTGLFDTYLAKNININENELPVILPYNDKVKIEPPEIELFPNSESPLWESYKGNNEKIENLNIEDTNTFSKQKNNNEKKPIEEEKFIKNNNIKISKLESKTSPDLKEEMADNFYKEKQTTTSTKKATLNNSINKIEEEKSATNSVDSEIKVSNVSVKFYTVQLASLSDEQLLDDEWKRLQKIYYPILNKFKYSSKKISLSDKIYHRMLVGKFENKKQALKFCKKINIEKECLIRFIE